MHRGAVDRSLKQLAERDQPVLRVEKQRSEHLSGPAAEPVPQIPPNVRRCAEDVFSHHRAGQIAFRQRDGGGDRRGLCGPDAALLREFIHRRIEQSPQRAVSGEQVARQLYRIALAGSGAQQQREQFGVGEPVRAARPQPFARTLTTRPICDGHVSHPVNAARAGECVLATKWYL